MAQALLVAAAAEYGVGADGVKHYALLWPPLVRPACPVAAWAQFMHPFSVLLSQK